jgi:hypothetical protein
MRLVIRNLTYLAPTAEKSTGATTIAAILFAFDLLFSLQVGRVNMCGIVTVYGPSSVTPTIGPPIVCTHHNAS